MCVIGIAAEDLEGKERSRSMRGKRAWGGVEIVHDPKLEVLVLGHAM